MTKSEMRSRCLEVFLKWIDSPDFRNDFAERCGDTEKVADSELAQMDYESDVFLTDIVTRIKNSL